MTREEFLQKNKELKQKVAKEIVNAQFGASQKSPEQLQGILKELELMTEQTCQPLYYPRIIVDTWNFSDSLGRELMELSEAYGKISKNTVQVRSRGVMTKEARVLVKT